KSLTSGEDNDLVIYALNQGYRVGYFPNLELTHLIDKRRLNKKYLAKLNFQSSKSWIKVLSMHNICPWKPIASWTKPLRKLKSFFTYKAWRGPAEYIKWRGTCG